MKYNDVYITIMNARNPDAPREKRRYPIEFHSAAQPDHHRATISIPLNQGTIDDIITQITHQAYNTGEMKYLQVQPSEVPDAPQPGTEEAPRSAPLMMEVPPNTDVPTPLDVESAIRSFGTILFKALFTRHIYKLCDFTSMHRHFRLRVRLFIQPDELAVLPWELMYNPQERVYLCLERSISLVRQVKEKPQNALSIETRLPLSVLGIVALSQDELALSQAASSGEQAGRLFGMLEKNATIRYVEGQSWEGLRMATSQQDQRAAHIFHFLGHGGLRKGDGGFVILKDRQGKDRITKATELAGLLRGQDIRLVVLNTCEGALADNRDRFSSTASTLASQGIPAVVAMHYKITTAASSKFAQAFYNELNSSGHIDSAVTEGRLALKDDPSSLEWMFPVLYLSASSGKLFEISRIQALQQKTRETLSEFWQKTLSTRFQFKYGFSLSILLAALIIIYSLIHSYTSPTPLHPQLPPQAACTSTGLSDGTRCFDSYSPDAAYKEAAAQALSHQQYADATTDLNNAIVQDPQDAEPQIYQNDLLANNHSHITLVVGVNFSHDFLGGSRDMLQGALIAQNEWDASHPTTWLSLLIANLAAPGQPMLSAQYIADQIIQRAKKDRTVLGVVGWETSDEVENINQFLLASQFPMISPSASSEHLGNISENFFRVASSDDQQEALEIKFAQSHLAVNATVATLAVDNTYSDTLGTNFQKDLHSIRPDLKIIPPDTYISGNKQSITQVWQRALASRPDLLFFPGYGTDLRLLLSSGLAIPKNMLILGSDGTSIMNDYPKGQPGPDVYFTAFASQSAWDSVNPKQQPAFFQDFTQVFGPPIATNDVQGVDEDTMLSYDALRVFLQAYTNVAAIDHKTQVSLTDMLEGIRLITTSRPLQGVSGKLAFDNTTDSTAPPEKFIVLEHAVNDQLEIIASQGCLQISQTRCP